MLRELCPDTVRVAERHDDPVGIDLLPGEWPAVARAVESRRREFATGRLCARVALAELGLPAVAVPQADDGAPVWPSGVVGSITHCAGYRAATVALSSQVRAIGVDAEPHGPLPDGVLEMVSNPRERSELATLSRLAHGVAWDRILFSAKECVYKVWAPVIGAFLDFDGADVTFDPDAGTFAARLLAPGAEHVAGEQRLLAGRFGVAQGLVLTAIVLPADAPGTRCPGPEGAA